jgi:ferrous iron transport protein A
MKTLLDCLPQKVLIIEKFIGGKNFRLRIAPMGFVAGAKIKVLKNDVGPLIVKVNNSRLALGRGQAAKIYGEIEE